MFKFLLFAVMAALVKTISFKSLPLSYKFFNSLTINSLLR